MQEHWLFVTVSLAPLLVFSSENWKWKALAVSVSLITVVSDTTFTLKLIVILSWLFTILLKYQNLIKWIYKSVVIRFFFVLFPVLMVLFVIESELIDGQFQNKSNLITQFKYKLFLDRGHLWVEAYNLIDESNFFVVPAGRDIEFNNSNVYSDNDWGAGAHNIYLEIGRQNGAFVLFSVLVMAGIFIYSVLGGKEDNNVMGRFSTAAVVVYVVYGLTGNSLVYDGVGFLFWLILGQIYHLKKIDLKHENLTLISSK
jgi:hypothetical protein